MKILFQYLVPYKWLVFLTMILAAINIGFSLIDPIIFGKLINLANEHQSVTPPVVKYSWDDYLFMKTAYTVLSGY
jgi:ATP-binding cassette subfamily B protein